MRDGAALSVVGVITRVGPLCRSAAFDADFDVSPSEAGGALPGGGDSSRDARTSSTPLTATDVLASKLDATGALGRRATIWRAHRWLWLRDGSCHGEVAVKVYTNSRLAQFAGCVLLR